MKERDPLPESLAEEWSYEEIKSSKKDRLIKKWYKDNAKSCPGCDKPFSDLIDEEIDFGHIVSQSWAHTYPHHWSAGTAN